MHFRLPRIIGYTQYQFVAYPTFDVGRLCPKFRFYIQRARITATERVITPKFHFETIFSETKFSRINLKANADNIYHSTEWIFELYCSCQFYHCNDSFIRDWTLLNLSIYIIIYTLILYDVSLHLESIISLVTQVV